VDGAQISFDSENIRPFLVLQGRRWSAGHCIGAFEYFVVQMIVVVMVVEIGEIVIIAE